MANNNYGQFAGSGGTGGGSGSTDFDGLTDTPANKTGQSLNFVRVNAGETALEYAAAPGGAPVGATYITQTPDATLSSEQALSTLATGIMKNTTATGVITIAAEGTDYYGPGGTDVAVADGGTGASNAAGAKTNLGFMTDLVDDTTPQLGGNLDINGNTTILSGADTLISFNPQASAVNYMEFSNSPTANSVNINAMGSDANISVNIVPKGSGSVLLNGQAPYQPGGLDVAVPDGGSGRSSSTAFAVICGGTTSTAAHQSVASVGTAGQALVSNGAGALPSFQTIDGNTLDEAYDQGGVGAGRVITADSGAVEINSTANIPLDVNYTTASTGTPVIGGDFNATLSSGTQIPVLAGTQSVVNVTGSASSTGALSSANATVASMNFVTWSSTGTATEAYGAAGLFTIGSAVANGTITTAGGTAGCIKHLGTGTITEGSGVTAQILNLSTGTITDAACLQAEGGSNPGGTITNMYGLRVKDVTAGTNNFAIKTGAGVVDHGSSDHIVVPNSGTFAAAATGEFGLDTTVADYTGMLKYHDGTEELTVLAMPTANLTTTDGHVVAYNATNDELEFVAPTAGSGNTLDQAYDQGGAGAGSTITADSGAVTFTAASVGGDDIFCVNHAVSGTLTSNTTNEALLRSTRSHTGGTTITDNFDNLRLTRTSEVNNAGATFNVSGSLLHLENTNTVTSGTLTDTAVVLNIVQDTNSTGAAAKITAGNAQAVDVDSTATTANVGDFAANSLTTGSILSLTSTSTSTGTRDLLFINNGSASATGARSAQFRQNSSADCLLLDKDEAGNALNIDQDANSASEAIGINLNVANAGAGDATAINVDAGGVDFGSANKFIVPNGGTFAAAATGEFGLDTAITDYTGMLKYHDGTEELTVLAVPTGNLSTTDGQVVAYSATNNELEFVSPSSGQTREAFFQIQLANNYNDYRTRGIGSSGTFRLNFSVPTDFGTLTSIEAIVAPTGGSAASGRDIDLFSDYGAIGESTTNHSESDTTITFDFSGSADEWTAMDLSSVFSSLAAGDQCGIFIDHNAVGGTVEYLGIRLIYTTA